MRKVIYSPMVSLDGFTDGPNHNLDWVSIDEELHSFINDQQRHIDTFLFGRRMYEVMKYWETADTDTSSPDYVLEFARLWKRIHKIVFSQALEQVQGKRRTTEILKKECPLMCHNWRHESQRSSLCRARLS